MSVLVLLSQEMFVVEVPPDSAINQVSWQGSAYNFDKSKVVVALNKEIASPVVQKIENVFVKCKFKPHSWTFPVLFTGNACPFACKLFVCLDQACIMASRDSCSDVEAQLQRHLFTTFRLNFC